MALLTGLAEARAGSYSSQAYEIYTRALARFDMRDVKAAVEELLIEPRKTRRVGESEWRDPAIPELGEMIERVKTAQRRRTAIPILHCEICDDQRLVVVRSPKGRFYAADCKCITTWRKQKAENRG